MTDWYSSRERNIIIIILAVVVLEFKQQHSFKEFFVCSTPMFMCWHPVRALAWFSLLIHTGTLTFYTLESLEYDSKVACNVKLDI